MENCLIADIGGTNCRFFMYKINIADASSKTEVFEKVYDTKAYKNIYQAMDAFMAYKVCVENPPKYCVIAIAGAPINNSLPAIANIAWEPFSGEDISTRYGFNYCKLLNDFEAVAYAFFSFKLESIPLTKPAVTNDPEKLNKDTLLVMGYGTGLGTVLVRNFCQKDKYTVVPQEGGHVGMSPAKESDWDLMKYVRTRFNIPEHNILSQELLCCGVGISAIYDYFCEKIHDRKNEGVLGGKQIFDLLLKPENKEVKEAFMSFYLSVVAHSWEQFAKAFLSNGGHLLIGGIVSIILERFYNRDLKKFFGEIKAQFASESDYNDAFEHVSIHFYEFDTQVFAIEGTLNYICLNRAVPKQNKFKTRLSDKDGLAIKSILKKPVEEDVKKPVEGDNKKSVEESIKKLIEEHNKKPVEVDTKKMVEVDTKKPVEVPLLRKSVEVDTKKPVEVPLLRKSVEEKKVAFEGVVSDNFEDTYMSNILKSNVMTMTGFFNSKSVKSKLFLAKVISEPTFKVYRIEKSRQRFQCYKLRFLDTICQLLVPTNIIRLLVNDIVLINDKDKLYHTKEDGWYFQTFDNIICDISDVIFNNLIDKFVANKPLLEIDKIHSKIKFEYTPTPPYNPRPEFDPERLLLVKGNYPIKSFNVLMRVLEIMPSTFIRRSNEKVEEFHPVKIQSQKYSYVVHFQKWSAVPTEPFYGYFVREDVILPGYLSNQILVMDDYTVVNISSEFNKFFPEGPLEELKINQMKIARTEDKRSKNEVK